MKNTMKREKTEEKATNLKYKEECIHRTQYAESKNRDKQFCWT